MNRTRFWQRSELFDCFLSFNFICAAIPTELFRRTL